MNDNSKFNIVLLYLVLLIIYSVRVSINFWFDFRIICIETYSNSELKVDFPFEKNR